MWTQFKERGNVHMPRGTRQHHPSSNKSSNYATVVSSFGSYSQQTARLLDYFAVTMKQCTINCLKPLTRSIRTDFIKSRSWAGRAALHKSPLNTAPLKGIWAPKQVAGALLY